MINNMMTSYTEQRDSFYEDLNTPFWADLNDVEYATLHLHELKEKQISAMYQAVNEMVPVFQRTGELMSHQAVF